MLHENLLRFDSFLLSDLNLKKKKRCIKGDHKPTNKVCVRVKYMACQWL